MQSAAAVAEQRLQLRSLYSQGGVSTVAQPREGMRDGVVRVIPSRLDKHTEGKEAAVGGVRAEGCGAHARGRWDRVKKKKWCATHTSTKGSRRGQKQLI